MRKPHFTREFATLLEAYKLRYRVFFVTRYTPGLRLSEGLALAVGDIDRHRRRIHVRGGQGRKDR